MWTTEATDKTPSTISNLKVCYSRVLEQNGKEAVIMETPAGKSGAGIDDETSAAIPFPMETLKVNMYCYGLGWKEPKRARSSNLSPAIGRHATAQSCYVVLVVLIHYLIQQLSGH